MCENNRVHFRDVYECIVHSANNLKSFSYEELEKKVKFTDKRQFQEQLFNAINAGEIIKIRREKNNFVFYSASAFVKACRSNNNGFIIIGHGLNAGALVA